MLTFKRYSIIVITLYVMKNHTLCLYVEFSCTVTLFIHAYLYHGHVGSPDFVLRMRSNDFRRVNSLFWAVLF